MINLLPTDELVERKYGRRNKILASYVAYLLVTAGLVASILVGSLRFVGSNEPLLRKQLEENEAQSAILESKVAELGKVTQRLTTTNKLFDSAISFSELIPKIGSLLPQGSILNGLSLNGGKTDPLSLEVDLYSADLAPILQSNLINSDLFEAADINSITSIADDTSVYKFSASVSASFTGSADAKKKIAAAAAAAEAAAKAKTDSGSTK